MTYFRAKSTWGKQHPLSDTSTTQIRRHQFIACILTSGAHSRSIRSMSGLIINHHVPVDNPALRTACQVYSQAEEGRESHSSSKGDPPRKPLRETTMNSTPAKVTESDPPKEDKRTLETATSRACTAKGITAEEYTSSTAVRWQDGWGWIFKSIATRRNHATVTKRHYFCSQAWRDFL